MVNSKSIHNQHENSELKPCPFCGGEAGFLNGGTIKCTKCGGAFFVTNPLISRYDIAKAWNTRTPNEKNDFKE